DDVSERVVVAPRVAVRDGKFVLEHYDDDLPRSPRLAVLGHNSDHESDEDDSHGDQEKIRDPEVYAQLVLNQGLKVDESVVEHLFELLPDQRFSRKIDDCEHAGSPPKAWASGVYRHGGVLGVRNSTKDYPLATTKVVNLFIQAKLGEQACWSTFSMHRSLNVKKHRDSHNARDKVSYLIPISEFKDGGLWVQLKADGGRGGWFLSMTKEKSSMWEACQVYTAVLNIEEMIVLWIHRRVVVHPVEPDGPRADGGDPPIPEMDVRGGIPRLAMMCAQEANDLMKFVEVGGDEISEEEDVRMMKASPENIYTPTIENIVSRVSPESPLKVTHTVDPREVLPVDAWIPAMEAELAALDKMAAIKRYKGQEAQRMRKDPNVVIVPSKLVFTIKPGAGCVLGGATIDLVRICLAEMNAHQGWIAATDDIKTAFLRAPIPELPNGRRYAMEAPKAMIRAGLAEPGELWLVTAAVSGFQRSPKWWSEHRNATTAKARWPSPNGGEMRIVPCVTDELVEVDSCGKESIVGYILFYVDDTLAVGPPEYVHGFFDWLEATWETSGREVVSKDSTVRFLGLELSLMESGAVSSKMPFMKEWATDEIPENVDTSPALIKEAQQRRGEILWTTQRTRPDAAYAAMMMARLTTRWPERAIQIAKKLLCYYNATKDAAFIVKPQQEAKRRSLVLWKGVAICWRAANQSLTALSSAEAELIALSEGAQLLRSVKTTLEDMGIRPDMCELRVDATAAIAVASSGGSWRSRHLRLREHWLSELVNSDEYQLMKVTINVAPSDEAAAERDAYVGGMDLTTYDVFKTWLTEQKVADVVILQAQTSADPDSLTELNRQILNLSFPSNIAHSKVSPVSSRAVLYKLEQEAEHGGLAPTPCRQLAARGAGVACQGSHDGRGGIGCITLQRFGLQAISPCRYCQLTCNAHSEMPWRVPGAMGLGGLQKKVAEAHHDSHLAWLISSQADLEFACLCIRRTVALFRHMEDPKHQNWSERGSKWRRMDAGRGPSREGWDSGSGWGNKRQWEHSTRPRKRVIQSLVQLFLEHEAELGRPDGLRLHHVLGHSPDEPRGTDRPESEDDGHVKELQTRLTAFLTDEDRCAKAMRISRRSTKGLDKEQDLEDPVIPFMVTIGLHTPDAHATYRALQLLSGNAVCKLKGAWPSNWRRITSPRRTVRGAAAHPAETAPCLGRPGGAAGSVGAQLRLSGGPDKPQLPAPRLVKCNFCYANSIAQALYWSVDCAGAASPDRNDIISWAMQVLEPECQRQRVVMCYVQALNGHLRRLQSWIGMQEGASMAALMVRADGANADAWQRICHTPG
ncbi:unnamed protein product, partial [Symbiodinium sp. KB8]